MSQDKFSSASMLQLLNLIMMREAHQTPLFVPDTDKQA
jgi:hypothetical protein